MTRRKIRKTPGSRLWIAATATVVPHQAVIKRDGKMANNNDAAGSWLDICQVKFSWS